VTPGTCQAHCDRSATTGRPPPGRAEQRAFLAHRPHMSGHQSLVRSRPSGDDDSEAWADDQVFAVWPPSSRVQAEEVK
jgi:hypothetical protein